MKISTRGRYALRVMIDLADHFEDGYTPLKEIADRQDISLKYVEAIMTNLSKHGLVDAKHGKSGGYSLNRNPSEYKASEILEITEGDLAPVSCLNCDKVCPRNTFCKTLPMWETLNKLIKDYLDSISLAELSKNTERFINGTGI